MDNEIVTVSSILSVDLSCYLLPPNNNNYYNTGTDRDRQDCRKYQYKQTEYQRQQHFHPKIWYGHQQETLWWEVFSLILRLVRLDNRNNYKWWSVNHLVRATKMWVPLRNVKLFSYWLLFRIREPEFLSPASPLKPVLLHWHQKQISGATSNPILISLFCLDFNSLMR